MNEPLELEDIAGLGLTIVGVLIESYVKEGYADPTMYRALKASAELAEQLRDRAVANGLPSDYLEGVSDLITNIELTAIECGEVVNSIIEENNFPIDKRDWSE